MLQMAQCPCASYVFIPFNIKFIQMIKNALLIALLAFMFAGCNNSHQKETDDHEGEEVKLQLTAYSPEFELFAEADPFVAGKSSNILSHFTHLPEFKALENGVITITLIAGSTETIQKLEKPDRKGIYSFDIKPDSPGKGRIVFSIKTGKGNYEIGVPDITVYATEQQADEAAENAEASGTNTVVLTKEQSWKIDFATAIPTMGSFGQVIKTSAIVQSAPGDEMLVSAKTNGIVLFNNNATLEGNSVSSGQGLFTVSGSDLADNNLGVRIVEAKNNFETTRLEYERKKSLASDKIVSDKDLLTAKNEYDNAKAVYDMLHRNFSVAGQSISSPLSGFVKQVFVTNGEYITAGQPVISISRNKTLLLRADVQQKYATMLNSITSANIRTLNDNKTYTLEELGGKVVSVGRNAGSNNYLIPVNLQIDNRGGFGSGGFVELYLKSTSGNSVLSLPNSALLEDQGNFFVFVQVTPELFEKREVMIGATDGLNSEIAGGLTGAERIVTKGAIFIRLAQSSGALDAHSGHVH